MFIICATSLSPLPDRFMSTVWPAMFGASRAIHANACAHSRAGMMPSVFASRLKPPMTYSSVTDGYSARPISERYECSGPTPG